MELKEFMPVRDSCVFYAQTFYAIRTLPTAEQRDEAYDMLFGYCFLEENPESQDPIMKAFILGLLPSYDAAAVRYAKSKMDGVKGGRPAIIDYEKIYALRDKGCSLADITAEVDCSLSTVRRILKNRPQEQHTSDSGVDGVHNSYKQGYNHDNNSYEQGYNHDKNNVNNPVINAHNPNVNVNVNDTVTVTANENANENKTANEHESEKTKPRANLLPKRDLKQIRKPEPKQQSQDSAIKIPDENEASVLRLIAGGLCELADYGNIDNACAIVKGKLAAADVDAKAALETLEKNEGKYANIISTKNLEKNRAVAYIAKILADESKPDFTTQPNNAGDTDTGNKKKIWRETLKEYILSYYGIDVFALPKNDKIYQALSAPGWTMREWYERLSSLEYRRDLLTDILSITEETK